MKPPNPLAVLVAAALLAATAAPDSMAAQQAEQSVTALPAAERAPVPARRTLAWGTLSAGDIADVNAINAYEAVSRLRATWLRPRGVTSLSLRHGVKVYLDGMRMGGVEELRQLDAKSIGSIQHLDGVEATLRFGTGNGDGAILVYTRR